MRKAAAAGLTGALKDNAPVLALALNTLAFEKQVEDRWRKYDSPAASRHLANEVDKDAVDAMADAVSESYAALSHRYYALKAKILGKGQLDFWDRNAPLTQDVQKSFSWGGSPPDRARQFRPDGSGVRGTRPRLLRQAVDRRRPRAPASRRAPSPTR